MLVGMQCVVLCEISVYREYLASVKERVSPMDREEMRVFPMDAAFGGVQPTCWKY